MRYIKYFYILLSMACLCFIAESLAYGMPTDRLPMPQIHAPKKITLNLQDAILLSLRYNPDIISEKLNRLEQRFALTVAHNALMPQYRLSGGASLASGQTTTGSIHPGISIQTPLGTTVDWDYSNGLDGKPDATTISVKQNLLKWGVPGLEYENSLDQEWANQIQYHDQVSQIIVSVIESYRQLVTYHQTLLAQEENIKRSRQQVESNKIRIQAGTIAANELLQVKSTLANNQLALISARLNFTNAKRQFLQTIGLNPNVIFDIDYSLPTSHEDVPNTKKTIALALQNNPAYRIAQIQLELAKRALHLTKIHIRPDLTIEASGHINGLNVSSHTHPEETGSSTSVQLGFSVPINHLENDQMLLQAKVALKNNEINLRRMREKVIFDVENDVESIKTQVKSIDQAKKAVALAKKNYQMALLQQKYGRISQIDIDGLQDILLNNQLYLIEAKITYLNQMTNLRLYCGTTLSHWNIQLRSFYDIEKKLR